MGRPRDSASVWPKSCSAPGFQPTTRPSRSTVTIATGLVSTIASAYCFRRWISRKSPALWMARTDWVAKAWRVETTSGEKAARSCRMMTRPPSSWPSRTSGTASSARVPSRTWSARMWVGMSCHSSWVSVICTGSRLTPARPTAPSPSRIGADRTTSRCSDEMRCVARA